VRSSIIECTPRLLLRQASCFFPHFAISSVQYIGYHRGYASHQPRPPGPPLNPLRTKGLRSPPATYPGVAPARVIPSLFPGRAGTSIVPRDRAWLSRHRVRHAAEFAHVSRDQREIVGNRNGRDEKVIGSDGLALRGKLSADLPVHLCTSIIECVGMEHERNRACLASDPAGSLLRAEPKNNSAFVMEQTTMSELRRSSIRRLRRGDRLLR
jgi:hypothetical protein